MEKALKVADASIIRAEAQRLAAEASVERAEAEFKEADDHVKRLEPLLAKEFATADQLEAARTRRLVADTSVREAQKLLAAAAAAVEQAKVERLRADDDIGQEGDVNARIAAAEAQLHEAELNLEYCRVKAPFSGKVVNFNISLGAFARAGVDVFTLVDTRTWYVVANFRETQLKHIEEGAPAEIYLQFKGGKRFKGKVVGLAWAVVPEDGTSAMRIAQRAAQPGLGASGATFSGADSGGRSRRQLPRRRVGRGDDHRTGSATKPCGKSVELERL